MAPCPGVDAPVANGQDLGVALSLALEALEVCQTAHHGEVVQCVDEYRAKQLERRERLEGKGK